MPASLTINPIKDALVKHLQEQQAALGLKSIKSDISLQDMVEAIKKELPEFPGVIVNYNGRTIIRSGTTMEAEPNYGVFLADRNISGPYVSGKTSIDLIEGIVEAIDGQKISPLQNAVFEFAGDLLMVQEPTLVVYQLIFKTKTVHPRRTR